MGTEGGSRTAAVFTVLTGGFSMLTAWGMAVTSTYSESATFCPSLLGRDLMDETFEGFCSSIVRERAMVVAGLVVLGSALTIVGAARGRRDLRRPSPLPEGRVSVGSTIAIAALGLATFAVAFPLVAAAALVGSSREVNTVINSLVPVLVAMAALLVALICTWIGRRDNRLTFDHAVTAVSLGTPLLVLFLIDLDGLGVTRRGLIDPELTFDGPAIFLTGVPVALTLVALVRHQNRGRPAPPAIMSGLALLLSAAALFLAMTPEAFSGGWGSDTDQSVARFFTFVTIAVVAPWVSVALWAPSQMGREEASSRQSALA